MLLLPRVMGAIYNLYIYIRSSSSLSANSLSLERPKRRAVYIYIYLRRCSLESWRWLSASKRLTFGDSIICCTDLHIGLRERGKRARRRRQNSLQIAGKLYDGAPRSSLLVVVGCRHRLPSVHGRCISKEMSRWQPWLLLLLPVVDGSRSQTEFPGHANIFEKCLPKLNGAHEI